MSTNIDPRRKDPKTRCPQCEGAGVIFIEQQYPAKGGRDEGSRDTFDQIKMVCLRCHGTGLLTPMCRHCEGKGMFSTTRPQGGYAMMKCSSCQGTGYSKD